MGSQNNAGLFIESITLDDIDVVLDLIRLNVDVNHGNPSPLNTAVRLGHSDIVDILISNGADVNDNGNYGDSPLATAIRAGQTKMVQKLINHGANVSPGSRLHRVSARRTQSLLHTSPLHVAAKQTDPQCLNILLAAGADVGLSDFAGNTALHVAAEEGCGQNVSRLIACGAPKDPFNKQGCTPLHLAVRSNQYGSTKELAKLGAAINYPTADEEGLTPVILAVQHGHLACVKALVASSCDVNKGAVMSGRTPAHTLIAACPHRDHWKKKGISVNKEIEIFDTLVQGGADVELRDKAEETPFHLGAKVGCPALMEYLIKLNVNVQTVDLKQRTPLQVACACDSNAVTKLLLQNCPLLVNYRPTKGDTMADRNTENSPLIKLCDLRQFALLRLLIEAGYKHDRSEVEAATDWCHDDEDVKKYCEDVLLQPWPLQRICRTTVRDLLGADLQRKIFKLPIPQKLRDMILLRHIFVPK